MISAIFNLIARLLDMGWHFLTAVLGFAWKLLTGLLDFGAQAFSALGRALFGPVSWGVDSLWGLWGGWNLWTLLGLVLSVLLIACAVFFLVAAGENLYRKYKK